MTKSPINSILFLLSTAISIILIAGCAGSLKEEIQLKPTAESVHSVLTRQFKKIEAFEAEVTLKVKYGMMSATFWGEYQADMPSGFHGEFRGPFGIFLAEVTTDSLEYEVILPKGQIETGSKESLDLTEMVGFPLPAFEPAQMFFPIALPPVSGKSIARLKVVPNSAYWEISETVDMEGFRRELTFDSEKRYVTRETWFNSLDELFLEKTYSDIELIDNIPIPKSLKLKMYGDQSGEITITFNDYEVNPGWKESPFQMKLKQGV
ncbi:hypothetical protein K8I28_15495 [bacterium]|nr:hypothetical protein [bacterium]